eukprot:TRINITY_DN15744_c0_g2_i4.p2 TRINITY_DN15744_c0_g2~~TRINITY_DN15744_c0_g2_i4.p2  ORF type:complete len:192 (-),score=-0.61 TRINITY_DN15744_c0_g2_i4:115-690(-)
MLCDHYVVCNECRGRTVRRLMRCVECCEELTGSFPVCDDGNCVDVSFEKEASNTGSCPRCNKRLRKEVCSSECNRRKTRDYLQTRKQLNGMVAVLVQNPKDCINHSEPGIWRPCSHFSYCEIHHEICKGHGKDTTCSQCKLQKKQLKRRASMDIYPTPKRRCISHIQFVIHVKNTLMTFLYFIYLLLSLLF